MKINWKVRFKNPVFIVQVLAAVFLPMLAYFGYKWEDMTSWGAILDVLVGAVRNPVVVVAVIVSVWNAVNDPTTKGLFDSEQARAYIKPR
ncbi:MAG: phage holin [Bacillota bacterium]